MDNKGLEQEINGIKANIRRIEWAMIHPYKYPIGTSFKCGELTIISLYVSCFLSHEVAEKHDIFDYEWVYKVMYNKNIRIYGELELTKLIEDIKK